MSHYANGVDHNGMLLFDVVIRGQVPELGLLEHVHLAPYHEEYIQTGPGKSTGVNLCDFVWLCSHWI